MIFQKPKHNIPKNILRIHKILKREGILGNYGPRVNFPDEPQFYQYACQRPPGKKKGRWAFGYGCDEKEDKALTIAIFEAIEHYCILYEKDNQFIKDSFFKLKNNAINPYRFVPFSEKQLQQRSYYKFRINDHTVLNWLPGYSLTHKKPVLIPASLVYANYNCKAHNEPIIQLKNSTGAACGSTLEFALYRGISEIIERHGYMYSFVHNIQKPVIDIQNNTNLTVFKRRIERYALEIYFLNTTINSPVVSITAILLDKTGSGPAVCTGLGGSLNIEHAIHTAGIEAVRRHISARDRFFRTKPLPMPEKYSFDWYLLEKQRYWSLPNAIQKAETFLCGKKQSYDTIPQTIYPNNDQDRVNMLVEDMKKKNYEILYVDTTVEAVKQLGLHVVKVLIPELIPLWRDERYPYLKYANPDAQEFYKNHQTNDNYQTQSLFSMHPF